MAARHIISLCILAAVSAAAIPLTAGYGSGSDTAAPDSAAAAAPAAPLRQTRRFYRRGDRIVEGYQWIDSPGGWAPDPYGSYVQAGGYVYQINRETQYVLRLVGATDQLAD